MVFHFQVQLKVHLFLMIQQVNSSFIIYKSDEIKVGPIQTQDICISSLTC